jgi:hypothetical protein
MIALLGVAALLMNGLLGTAASDASLARTARVVSARLNGAPPRNSARLRLGSTLGLGFPPSQIVILGTGFQDEEGVAASGTLTGLTTDGRSITIKLDGQVFGPNDGSLTIRLFVPDSTRFTGPYRLHIAASGDLGSSAALDVTAGGPATAVPTEQR